MLGRLIPPCPRGNYHKGPCGLTYYSWTVDMSNKIVMLRDYQKKLYELMQHLNKNTKYQKYNWMTEDLRSSSPDTATRSRSQNRTPGSADEASWQTSGTR